MHKRQRQFRLLSAFPVYLLLTGIATFAMGLINVVSMIYQVETVRLNPLQLVLVGTVLETTCFLLQVPTGILADTYSRRLSVVLGYSMMGLGFLLQGMIPTFLAILLAQVLWGSGSTFVSGAEEAWCADEIAEERVATAFMRATQIGQIAGLLSIPVGIWLAMYRLHIPIIIGACLLLLLGLFLFFCMPEQHFQPVPRTERTEQSSWRALGQTVIAGGQAVKSSPMLLLILGVTIFAAMSSEGFDRLETDHFIKDFHFPTIGHLQPLTWFGIINGGAMLLTLIITEVIRRRLHTRKQGNEQSALIRAMFLCYILLIVGTAVFALTGNFYLAIVAYWLARIGRRADMPLYNAWITRNSEPRTRATVFSMFGQVDAVGQTLSGPVIGYIGTIASLRVALATASVVLGPCVIFFLKALKLSKYVPTYSEEQSGADNPGEEGKEDILNTPIA